MPVGIKEFIMEEIWKIINIDGIDTWYSISNLGRVRNNSTGTYLQGSVSGNGYILVHLRQRIDKMCSVHRLVMKAFKPCKNMDDLQINHIDGNKQNNCLDNLEWSTALENMRHSFETGLQPRQLKKCFQYDLDGNFIQEFYCCNDAARKLNLDVEAIWECVTERRTICHQFQFKSYFKLKINPWHNPQKKICLCIYRQRSICQHI